MIVKLLTEHHLELLSLKRGCRGSSESTFVKMSNCWKSHAADQLIILCTLCIFRLSNLCSIPRFAKQSERNVFLIPESFN